MIHACMQSVEIARRTDGTEVRMVSNTAPLSAPLLQHLPGTVTISLPVRLRT